MGVPSHMLAPACRMVPGACLLSAVLMPVAAVAQLRGLGGGGLGGVGLGAPSPGASVSGPYGGNGPLLSTPPASAGRTGAGEASPLPGAGTAINTPAHQVESTVTNTLSGDVVRPLAITGNALSNTAKEANVSASR